MVKRWQLTQLQASKSLLFLVLLTFATAMPASSQLRLPELQVEAPDQLKAISVAVRQLDIGRLGNVMRLIGLQEAGEPIRVVLVTEDSRLARDTSPWVAAFADPTNDLVVMFPARIGAYPYDSVEVVLHHEVAHILASRAAGGNHLPRWFSEGLASTSERSWGISSRSRFLLANVTNGEPTIAELDRLFYGTEPEIGQAYTIAHALVRNLVQRYGPSLIHRVLASMASGETFETSFFNATGSTIDSANRIFWDTGGGWEEWVTFLASPFIIWTLITILALAAIWRHRRRRAERQLQWEEDERFEDENWKIHRSNYRVH